MRKVRLVKIVIPEMVTYIGPGPDIDNMEPDYQCPECGFGIAHAYMFCPYCGAELDWRHVRMPTERFIKIGGTIEDFEEPRKGQLFMREEVDVNKLIAEFSDMAGRCSLLTGDVEQEELLIQIIGTIAKVAMGR
ncbi:zinc ribbon domain-containing protein [[Clostridium] symbiosum]|uniref:zinc ribbon domain-containing protein n=1 Tax=Clostridium symbiosum TaxID=1512 RepID=UPI00189A4B07|nr:zinc ribbon domain-containing protein [[Clostridium] symbiosum]MDB2016437.1 zinc ribbon domain-containing protein [[Clostridium] symbiosum]